MFRALGSRRATRVGEMCNYWRSTRIAILVTSFVCAVISATLANTEPMAVVRQYVDAINKGDADAIAATCADPTSVLDGMAPHISLGSIVAEIGIGTCWRPARGKVLQHILSLSASLDTRMLGRSRVRRDSSDSELQSAW
jgi:hypothetical protein